MSEEKSNQAIATFTGEDAKQLLWIRNDDLRTHVLFILNNACNNILNVPEQCFFYQGWAYQELLEKFVELISEIEPENIRKNEVATDFLMAKDLVVAVISRYINNCKMQR